jgi:hypothetical protein
MIVLVSAAAAAAGVAAPLLSHLEVEGREVTVREMSELDRCRDGRILPDPTSRRAVVWEAPRDLREEIKPAWPSGARIIEFPARGSPQGPRLHFFGISASTRVDPLRWSANGDRLLLRVDKTGAALYDPITRQLATAPDFDPLFMRMAIEALSHGDTGFYRQPATLETVRRIRREGALVRWLASVGPDGTRFLVFRLGNGFRMSAYDGDQTWDTKVPIAFASSPLLPPDGRRPTFLGDQTGFSTFLSYALPILDRNSGRVIGRFGLERIELNSGQKIDLAPVFNQLMTIRDATANANTIFALVDLEREMRIVRVQGDEVHSWHLCDKKGIQLGTTVFPRDNFLPADIPVVRTEVHFAPNSRGGKMGPFGLLYRPRQSDGRLVVFFHGGPTATLADTTVPREVQDFAGAGVSVLAVEQSGMLGGGLALSTQLPRLGHEALRQDIAVVTQWVRRSGYRRVYLLADSFGAASAVIAANAHRDAYEHVFLRAPYLAVRPPEQSASRREFGDGVTSPETAREFEEAVYGGARGRTRFAADLRASVNRLRPSSKLSIYFGSRDPVSAPSDLPPAFAGHPSVMIVNGSHEMTARNSAVENDIFSKMGIKPGRSVGNAR